jgi:hypothetical protein
MQVVLLVFMVDEVYSMRFGNALKEHSALVPFWNRMRKVGPNTGNSLFWLVA